ncbi:hypothetical protein MKW98_013995 [Papaver atlanticum]|uniref:TFIIB-type domain-containing protein n=1 Tax=Papaver atlanticum TaxID=357466 RepID=A0AAD4XFD0_9MAGN|nr:hypothetical protein MKW98_013995 [Papaver atlanticum]
MEETYHCSDCKSVTAVINDHSTGDTICSDCGLVLEAYSIDETSEWRTFPDQSNHNDPQRVGDKSNLLLSNNGLTTLIFIPPSSNSYLRRFNHATMKDPDKGLIEAFKAIEAMSERLGLVSTIKDLANEIYKKMEDVKSSKERNKNAMFAACLYIACEKLKNPRRMKEICWAANDLKKKILGRAITEIKKILDKRMDDGKARNAGDFLKRFCSLLGMNNKAVEAAQEAFEKTQEVIDIRRAPASVVASIIYMIAQLSGDRKHIQDVADATGVKPATIKKCYEEIYPFASRLVPAWYANEEDLKKLCIPRRNRKKNPSFMTANGAKLALRFCR